MSYRDYVVFLRVLSYLAQNSLDLQKQELQWRGFLLRKKNVRIQDALQIQ